MSRATRPRRTALAAIVLGGGLLVLARGLAGCASPEVRDPGPVPAEPTPIEAGARAGPIEVNQAETPRDEEGLHYRIVLRNRGADEFVGGVRVLWLDESGVRLVFVERNRYRQLDLAPGEWVELTGRAPSPRVARVALDLRQRVGEPRK